MAQRFEGEIDHDWERDHRVDRDLHHEPYRPAPVVTVDDQLERSALIGKADGLAWLTNALAECSHLNLDHPDGRAQAAEKILAALPGPQIAAVIAESARTVLTQRIAATPLALPVINHPNDARKLGREIGNNAAQTVLFALGGDS